MLRNICWSRVDLNPANASTTDADGGTGVVKTIFSAYVRSTTFPCQLRALPHGENILIVEIILSSSSSYIKIPFIGSFTESCTTASCGVGWHRVARSMLQYEKGFLHPETPTKITRQIVGDRGHPLRLKNHFFLSEPSPMSSELDNSWLTQNERIRSALYHDPAVTSTAVGISCAVLVFRFRNCTCLPSFQMSSGIEQTLPNKVIFLVSHDDLMVSFLFGEPLAKLTSYELYQ